MHCNGEREVTKQSPVTECKSIYNVAQGPRVTGHDPERTLGPQRLLSTNHSNDTQGGATGSFNLQLRDIFMRAVAMKLHNYRGARIRVPSAMKVVAWRHYLADYHDPNLVDFIEFGWPVNYVGGAPLVATGDNHKSSQQYLPDIDFYVKTELSHRALAGPFRRPPVANFHTSPLMTRPKRDAKHRRVIMDLSWPKGAAANDNISKNVYVDGPAVVKLPTVDYMVKRLLDLGPGAYMYKTDLARGYRQLRVDPGDWPLLGFQHRGLYFMDICPPFGLSTSALCMQRTSEAITYIHGKEGFYSRP